MHVLGGMHARSGDKSVEVGQETATIDSSQSQEYQSPRPEPSSAATSGTAVTRTAAGVLWTGRRRCNPNRHPDRNSSAGLVSIGSAVTTADANLSAVQSIPGGQRKGTEDGWGGKHACMGWGGKHVCMGWGGGKQRRKPGWAWPLTHLSTTMFRNCCGHERAAECCAGWVPRCWPDDVCRVPSLPPLSSTSMSSV